MSQLVVNLVFIALGAFGIGFVLALRRTREASLAARAVVGGFLSLNGFVGLFSLGLALVALSSPMPVLAQGTTATPSTGGAEIGAALATGLACIGAGIGVGIAGAAAIGAITERPEVLGRTLIFIGLAEGVAIYGLIISFMVLNR